MAAVIAAEISNANAATFTYSQKDNARPPAMEARRPKVPLLQLHDRQMTAENPGASTASSRHHRTRWSSRSIRRRCR
jgi:hypothetical protein